MILLGKRIKELRNKSKLTQSELAEKVGVTKSTIASYENDSRTPSYEVLIKMASVFKVSTDSLLLGSQSKLLDVQGLTQEQLTLLENLVVYFKKANLIDSVMLDNIADVKKYLRDIELK